MGSVDGAGQRTNEEKFHPDISPTHNLNWPDQPVTDAGRGRIHNGI